MAMQPLADLNLQDPYCELGGQLWQVRLGVGDWLALIERCPDRLSSPWLYMLTTYYAILLPPYDLI